jgi:hypothetical protein
MVRPYSGTDLALIKAWHEQSGFGYPLPDLSSPLLCVFGVAESEGEPVAAAGIKLIGEEYLWLNPAKSDKAQALAAYRLQRAVEKTAAEQFGLESISAWLPPEIEKRFGGTIERLGWIKSPWQNYTKFL